MKLNKKLIISLLLPLLLFIVFEYPYYCFNSSIIISLLIIYSIYFILLSILKKAKITILIMGILIFVMQVINIGKMQFIGNPLYLTDIFYTGDMNEILNLIKDDLGNTIIKLLPNILIILFIIILIIVFSYKLDVIIKNNKKRIIIFSISFIIMILLFLPIRSINNYILKYFYNDDSYLNHISIKTSDDFYKYYGHLSGMYGNLLETRVYKPNNYNRKEITKIVKNSKKENDSTFRKPNIIVIFSESFFDINKIDEIKFDKDITSNYNKLKEEGLSFNMIAPFYGGLSANVEYEFLTGGSTNYYSESYVPYMELYNSNKYYNAPSIISELKKNDYYTKIVAYYSDKLYNCGRVYKYMGVDDVDFIPNVKSKYIKGQYVSDKYVVDNIINEFNNKKDNPLFYMTMTMQSHMPYLKDKYDNYDIDIVKSNLDSKYNDSLKSYAQGIYDADKELGRLYDYISSLDEDTIIVFYGDHLPYLESFNYMKYFNTSDERTNILRKYNTESLIVANYDISDLKKENLNYLDADLLSSYILNHMDIEVSDYYRWLYSTRNIIGASNRYITTNQDNNIYYTNSLSNKQKKLYNLRKNIQYRYFHDIK